MTRIGLAIPHETLHAVSTSSDQKAVASVYTSHEDRILHALGIRPVRYGRDFGQAMLPCVLQCLNARVFQPIRSLRRASAPSLCQFPSLAVH
jgi:hypothetical protein